MLVEVSLWPPRLPRLSSSARLGTVSRIEYRPCVAVPPAAVLACVMRLPSLQVGVADTPAVAVHVVLSIAYRIAGLRQSLIILHRVYPKMMVVAELAVGLRFAQSNSDPAVVSRLERRVAALLDSAARTSGRTALSALAVLVPALEIGRAHV